MPEVPEVVQGMPRPRACRAPRCPGSGPVSAPLAARVMPAAACERHRIPGGQLGGEGERQRGAGHGGEEETVKSRQPGCTSDKEKKIHFNLMRRVNRNTVTRL